MTIIRGVLQVLMTNTLKPPSLNIQIIIPATLDINEQGRLAPAAHTHIHLFCDRYYFSFGSPLYSSDISLRRI